MLMAACDSSKSSLVNSPILLQLSEMRGYTLRIQEDNSGDCQRTVLNANRGDRLASFVQKVSVCKTEELSHRDYDSFLVNLVPNSKKTNVAVSTILGTLDLVTAWCEEFSPIVISTSNEDIRRDYGCVLVIKHGRLAYRLDMESDSKLVDRPTIRDLIKLTESKVKLMNELGK